MGKVEREIGKGVENWLGKYLIKKKKRNYEIEENEICKRGKEKPKWSKQISRKEANRK